MTLENVVAAGIVGDFASDGARARIAVYGSVSGHNDRDAFCAATKVSHICVERHSGTAVSAIRGLLAVPQAQTLPAETSKCYIQTLKTLQHLCNGIGMFES